MLTGVVVHSGSMRGGHYVAYVRARQSHCVKLGSQGLPEEVKLHCFASVHHNFICADGARFAPCVEVERVQRIG